VSLERWRPGVGEWNVAAATHLLVRGGFGPAPDEAEELAAGTVDAAVDRLLADDTPDARLRAGASALLAAGNVDRLAGWWMALILSGGAPLRERTTLMWHDHFATSHAKVDDVRMMHAQNELFREHGLGDFRALLHAVARDPAMLVWLDGNSNKAGQPNENFAREVMELFALGIGNYTEVDVQEAARALTGWGTEGRGFRLRAADHDAGRKTVFGKSGRFGGEDVIELVLAHPACAHHVARRLLVEFVAPDPQPGWVEEVALVLVANDWHVGRTIEVLLRSELFFSPSARRSRVAGPVELVARSVRRLGARVPPQRAAEACARMGQSLFRPPSVKGWDGHRTWINAGTWVARHNTLVALAEAHAGEEEGTRVDLTAAFPSALDVAPGLIPELTGSPFSTAVARATSESGSADEQLVAATALVLTSPEYHLT